MTTETKEQYLSYTDYIPLAGLVTIAFLIKWYFLQFFHVISADGIAYVNIAKDFVDGRGLAGAVHFPPFYPILVGLTSLLVPDFELAGRLVSMVMGSLIVVPVYLLAREFFDRRAGLIAAVLAISWPSIRSWSNEVMSQATYMTLVLFGIYLLWRAWKRASWPFSLLGGVCLCCAYLTRPEGVLLFLALTAVLMVASLPDSLPARRLVYLLIAWVAFFVVSFPYLNLLHELTGRWQLSGKSSVTLADALSEYLKIPDLKHVPAFKDMDIGYMDVIRKYPGFIVHNLFRNIKDCRDEMLSANGWVLAAIGFVMGRWERQRVIKDAYLLATFVPLAFIAVFFFVGPEYTQPYLPILFLWIGKGLLWLEESTSEHLGDRELAKRLMKSGVFSLLLVAVFAGVTIARQIPSDRHEPYSFKRDGGRFDDKQIGIKLRTLLPKNAVIMTRSGRIGFYSQRRYVMPPQAGYAEIVEFAKKNKVDYLIATTQLLSMRPQLEFLYGPLRQVKDFTPPPELELVHVGQEPGGLPYLVYRFRI